MPKLSLNVLNWLIFDQHEQQMHNKKAWRQELQDVLTHIILSSKLETIKRNPHLSMQSNLLIPKGQVPHILVPW